MISEPPVLLGPQRTSSSKTATLVNRSWTLLFQPNRPYSIGLRMSVATHPSESTSSRQ